MLLLVHNVLKKNFSEIEDIHKFSGGTHALIVN